MRRVDVDGLAGQVAGPVRLDRVAPVALARAAAPRLRRRPPAAGRSLAAALDAADGTVLDAGGAAAACRQHQRELRRCRRWSP